MAALKEQLRGELAGGGVLCVLDLEPGLGIQVAAELRIAAVANAVIVIPRWPYAEAVLPVSQLLWTLASQARRLPTDDRRLPSAVFVLDNQRSRGLTRPTPDRRADNRYALGPGDLPSFATLRERGIRRILKLTNP